jgi:hypothetical protein
MAAYVHLLLHEGSKMKSHIPWVLTLCVVFVSAVGCDKQGAKREQERRETARMMEQTPLMMAKRGAALREQLKQGLQPVIDCALQRFRKAAEQQYGASAVEKAKITAEASKLKELDDEKQEIGSDKWEVTIRYVGKDESGKDVDEQWIATVGLMIDTLNCQTAKRK